MHWYLRNSWEWNYKKYIKIWNKYLTILLFTEWQKKSKKISPPENELNYLPSSNPLGLDNGQLLNLYFSTFAMSAKTRADLSKSIPAHKFLRVEHTIFYLFSWLSIYCSKLFVCGKLQKHLTLGLARHYTKFSSSKITFNCKDLLASDNHLFKKSHKETAPSHFQNR